MGGSARVLGALEHLHSREEKYVGRIDPLNLVVYWYRYSCYSSLHISLSTSNS